MSLSIKLYMTEFRLSPDAISDRGLIVFEEAGILEVAEVGIDGRDRLLTPAAARQWRLMKKAALSDGETIFIVSGFRSISRQAEIIRDRLGDGESIDDIVKVFAPPGFSEHHSGCAVDLSTPGVLERHIKFENTSAFKWLCQNAERFGYYLPYPPGNAMGYNYEPWHWCYRPA